MSRKAQKVPGQPLFEFAKSRTEKHLTKNVAILIVDKCFENGPIDLTDDTSWNRIQDFLRQHCQVF